VGPAEIRVSDGANPRQDPRWRRIRRPLTFPRCSRSCATPVSNSSSSVDIVHRRTPENVERLLELLLQLDATMRYDFANRGLRPTAELLAGKGHLNLSTSLGPLDPLCDLDGLGFDELLPHSQSIVDEGRLLRVLDLPTLITVKTKAGRPKDRLVLPILIATLEERDKPKR
jgi:hypothetical protein